MKFYHLLIILFWNILLSSEVYAHGSDASVSATYGSGLLPFPGAAETYRDSVYLENLNASLPFNFDTYYDRFMKKRAEELADENFYFYYVILKNIPRAQALYELDRMTQIAREQKSKALEHEAEFWRTVFLNEEEGLSMESIIYRTQPLIDKAEKRGDSRLKYKGMSYLMKRIWEDPTPDYSYFFLIALQIADELEQNPTLTFTCAGETFFLIGNAYYHFREYDKAVFFLEKTLSAHSGNFYDRSNILAKDILTTYYEQTNQNNLYLTADKQTEEKYDPIHISRAAQLLSETKSQSLKNKEQTHQQKLLLVFISITLSVIIIFLCIYRKRKKAHHKRSDREIQIAGVEEALLADSDADNEDIMVFQSIKNLIETEQIFRNPILSPDVLAEHMGISRKMVVKSISRMQKKNFTQFINEFRIQEAIGILSNPSYIDMNFDEIAIDCGFYDRKTFFRIFKKETGISPVDFRKNELQSQ